MRLRRTAAVVLLAACFAACSLAGLTGSPEPESPDSSTLDDGAVGDSRGPIGDAAAADADATVQSFPGCDGQALCDTFDDAPLGALWSGIVLQGGGMVELDDSGALSPPNALRVTLPAIDASTVRRARLVKVFPGADTTVRCAFDLKYVQLGFSVNALTVYLDLGSTAGSHGLNFTFGSLGGTVSEVVTASDGGRVVFDYTVPAVSNNNWHHLVIEVTKSTLRFWNDDAGLVDAPLVEIPSPARTFMIGMIYGVATDPWDIRFDNVVCDVSP